MSTSEPSLRAGFNGTVALRQVLFPCDCLSLRKLRRSLVSGGNKNLRISVYFEGESTATGKVVTLNRTDKRPKRHAKISSHTENSHNFTHMMMTPSKTVLWVTLPYSP